MASNDPLEWRLIDTDLETVLGILPLGPSSRFYLELNEPGSWEAQVPLNSQAARLAASGMYVETRYRGAVRGGGFVENLSQTQADMNEGAGRWMKINGRGPLALLEDAIVWDDGTNETKRVYDSAPMAHVLIEMIEEAKARGCLQNLTYDFTSDQDSEGNYWDEMMPLELTVGTSLLEVARDFAKQGMDIEMVRNGEYFNLSAYQDGKGSDKSGTIHFRVGVNCEEVGSLETGGGIKNVMRVRYDDGYTTVMDEDSIAARRRREGLLDAEYAGNSGAARIFGRAELERTKNPKYTRAVKIYDGVGPRAFEDYDIGDWVTLDDGETQTRYRVRGMQLEWNGSRYADVVVDLASTIYENEIRMAQDIRDLQERWRSAHDANELDVLLWAAIGEQNDASSVACVRIDGSLVYVGGTFELMGGVAAKNIAVYNIESSSWAALGAGVSDHCNDIEVIGGIVYAAGSWGVAKWDGTSWSVMSGIASGTDVYSLAALGTDLLAAGNITTSTGWVVKRWNGSAWSTLGTEIGAKVWVIRVNAGEVYIGGEFVYVNGGTTRVDNIAKLNGAAWEGLGGGLHDEVDALAFIGSNVYAGGWFTKALGGPADYVAMWDGTTWSELGLGVNGAVSALAVVVTDVYVGGLFTTASGVPCSRIAKWDGGSWSALTTGLNGSCYGLAVYNLMDIYVVGGFTVAGDVSAHRVAGYLTTLNSIHRYLENASGYVHPNHSGDVHSVGDGATTIQPNKVNNTKLDDMEEATVKGRPLGAGYGDPVDLTAEQLLEILGEISGGGAWGEITGTLSDQTDLQSALDAKLSIALGVLRRILFTDGSGNVATDEALQFLLDGAHKQIWMGSDPMGTSAYTGVGVHVVGDGGAVARFRALMYGGNLATAPGLSTYRGGGTKASPSALTAGTIIGQWVSNGLYDGSGTMSGIRAAIYVKAAEDWTATSHPTKVEIYTCPVDSTTLTLVMTINADGSVAIQDALSLDSSDVFPRYLNIFKGGVRLPAGSGDVYWMDNTFSTVLASMLASGNGMWMGRGDVDVVLTGLDFYFDADWVRDTFTLYAGDRAILVGSYSGLLVNQKITAALGIDVTGGEMNVASGMKYKINGVAHTHGTAEVDDDAITNAKAANMAQATIKGRASGAGTGDPTDLTPAQARTIINVADGATANAKATGAEITTGTDDVKFATAKALADAGFKAASPKYLAFGVYAGTGPFSAAATPYAVTIDRTMTLVKVTYSFYVATTNNGSNYWKITLDKAGGTTVKELNTAAAAANTFAQVSWTFSATSVGTADVLLRVALAKVGSPGNIYLPGPALEISV